MPQKSYHIEITEADTRGARYALLPGDPGRVPAIAAHLENSRKIGVHREYTSYLGTLAGEPVLVMSTGMGGPSTAIAVEELAQIGVRTLLRIGTCGGMQPEVEAGHLVTVQAAIRQEGTSREYLPLEYPAVADLDVTLALRAAAGELGIPNHVGVAQCKDSFYGQHDPQSMPVGDELAYKWRAWVKGGALCSEMETAALYTVCSVRRLRAGAVMLCVWNQERERLGLPQAQNFDTENAIRTAVRAVELLIEAQRCK